MSVSENSVLVMACGLVVVGYFCVVEIVVAPVMVIFAHITGDVVVHGVRVPVCAWRVYGNAHSWVVCLPEGWMIKPLHHALCVCFVYACMHARLYVCMNVGIVVMVCVCE